MSSIRSTCGPFYSCLPQRSCGKVMFLHVSVIPSRQTPLLAGRHPHGQTHTLGRSPWQADPSRGRQTPTPAGRHPTPGQTPPWCRQPPLGRHLAPGQTAPPARHPPPGTAMQWMVRILLERILVLFNSLPIIMFFQLTSVPRRSVAKK